jgi:acetyl esterase
LTAPLVQRAADGTAPPIVFQLLRQPVLEDRPMPSKDEFVTTPGLDGPAVTQMWRHYFVGEPVQADAVPARAAELTGVASTLITCSELDPLRDEAVDYALRLLWAGVATELHVFPGTCHGFDSLLPEWETSQQLFKLQGAALRRALHHAASSRAMAAW